MRSAVALAMAAVVVLGCNVEADEVPPATPAANPDTIAGTVLETLDVSSYTYVRLETESGEVWAAIPSAELEIGSQVVIAQPQAMSNFTSKTLERQFDTIYFGTLEGAASGNPHTPASNPHGTVGPMHGRDVSVGPIEVAKAEGTEGHTVAELYAAKAGLDGKTVAVRGKVVKYNAGIMGRNWIHLQDGTGDMAAGTHDLTVTTSATAALGDIILVKGTVALDKDFGAGYHWALIVENGTVE